MDIITYGLLNKRVTALEEKGGSLPIHICTSDEYDHSTGVPTISSPDEGTLYLVPASSATTGNLFDEWVYVDSAWEKVGSASINIEQSDWAQTDTTAQDYIKNKPAIPDAQIQSDWGQNNASSVDYIKNKPFVVNANQGVENAGKILGIGNDGVVAPVSASGGVLNDNTIGSDTTWSSQKIDNTKANKEPHNYAFDGVDLSTIFADADELYAAYNQEDYGKIHIGDYWPVTLNGTFRDYGMMTCQQGQTYYSDTELTAAAGTADANYDATPVGDANIPGCHKPYCEVTINTVKYYCDYDECLEYREKTLSNALMKFEVAGINQYWRYGDSGANSFQNGVPHLLLSPRDGLPTALKMRKCNEQWEGQHIATFTGDGTTAEFTINGTVGTIGYVFVAGAKKTYNTDYTYASNKITFKAGKIPANGAEIKIEWMDGTTPWNGCAMYRTFNDPEYGIIKLIQQADAKLYAHIYKGTNDGGMRYYGETRNKTNTQGGAWANRGVLFLPTEDEIWGRLLYGANTTHSVNMQQWPIYSGGRRHFAKGAGNAASRSSVWCCSSTNVTTFALVSHYGNPYTNYATYAYVAAPCFLLS